MKSIKGYQRVLGRKWAYCLEFEDCYDIVKRGNGWAATKNGEFIEKYYYNSKFAAASRIPNVRYK